MNLKAFSQVEAMEELKKYIVDYNEFSNGKQLIFQFDNGYGASFVNHDFSYGNEIAVLKDNDICYDTEITDDVLAYLTDEEVIQSLLQIKGLKTDRKELTK